MAQPLSPLSTGDEVEALPDLPGDEVLYRKLRDVDVARDLLSGDVVVNPNGLVFDPELSVHRKGVIDAEHENIAALYGFTTFGAIEFEARIFAGSGARVKQTPSGDPVDGVLGRAHASVFGADHPRPSKTQRSAYRTLILDTCLPIGWPDPT
jgi:hypothetical protein